MAYSSFDTGSLRPAEEMTIKRYIYFESKKADISTLTALPLEQLQTMREESVAAEQVIFKNLQESTKVWEAQAGQTLSLNKAIEYIRTPPIQHTSNKWQPSPRNSDLKEKSNSVYTMTYYVHERTRYDRELDKSVPIAWTLSWSVRTQTPGDMKGGRIAGQDKKLYTDKAAMEKYLSGREKAYAHLFTEISPPIPKENADCFRVNGQLLPGYTVEGEEPAPPEHSTDHTTAVDTPATDPAADMGGVSISTENEPRKESEPMKEPLNIQLVSREAFESGNAADGAWLKLPATADQLQTALARIGVQDGDFRINDFEAHVFAVGSLERDIVLNADLNDLNFLAAQIEKLDDTQLEKLNAACLNIDEDIKQLAELAGNTDFYEHYPDIKTTAELGAHVFEKAELIQIPEAWAGAVDLEKLGQLAAESEKGIFTAHGYIVESGAEWKPITEIPQEYKIAPKIEYDSIAAADPPTKQQNATAAVDAAPFVLTADNPRDKLKEITDKLENGIKGIFESEQYKKCLDTFSKFHNYSFNNCVLIAMQNPTATHVAGFNAWQADFKRQVQKGEKGIKIIAPAPFTAKKEVDKLDAKGQPIVGKDGKTVKETQEVTVPSFKVATVFDVSQTDGEPLPQLGVSELIGSVDQYKDFFAAVEKISPVPVGFEEITGGAKGYFSQEEKRIAINEGMGELQNLKTLIHEIAHARIHDIDRNAPKDEKRADRNTREVEAESIAYTVCQHYGLDTSDYSFGYVAGWSNGKDLEILKSSLDTIRKDAGAIIGEIDKHFAELTKDKVQTAEQTKPEVTPPVDLKVVADYMQKQHDIIKSAEPGKVQSQAVFDNGIKRLEQVNERIPAEHTQLKSLLASAANSPDLQTLQTRMDILKTDFIQHHCTAKQDTITQNGKADPPKATATTAQAKINPQAKSAPKPKQEKSSIRKDLAANKEKAAGQKSAPQKTATKNKNAELGG